MNVKGVILMGKMKNCKSCGKEIANSAKTCPSCGAKIKNLSIKQFGFGL